MDMIDSLKVVTSRIKDWTDDNKVQKEIGKGLSTNDYTTLEKNKVASIPNDLVILGDKLYLAKDGITIDSSAVTLPSGGGGGGGGGSSSAITLKNLLDSNMLTSAAGQSANLKFSFSSSETNEKGTAYIYVNNVLKTSVSIVSGENNIDVSAYIIDGINEVKLTCMDIFSNQKSLSYSVKVVTLKITSSFDSTVAYEGQISYPYIAIGDVDNKIVHFVLDEIEIGTANVSTSGRQNTFTIPTKSHGAHTFEVYVTSEIGGVVVQSNHLYYDLIFVGAGETTPIISCAYNNKNMVQYETITIPYIVYSPVSLTSDITLSVNGKVISNLIVDRTQQIWSFRADEYGQLKLSITCGEIVKNISIDVIESPIDIDATTDGLELFLSSYGRNNNEANPAEWSYNNISCIFENYNWTSDGWKTDKDGIPVHRVTGDARLIIPIQLFALDFRTTGKTIEFEFSTSNVRNYDAEVISCYSGSVGFDMTAQMATLKSEQSEISTQYKENEHIRLSFVVQKRVEDRLIFIYLNGIMCGSAQYPVDDDFTQASPVNITIGSNDCTIDLYNIRVYNNDLTRYQILDNWIADTQDIALKTDRYARNNIFDAYGKIVIDKLPANLPYLIFNAKTLPQYKGNKLTVDGEYVNLIDPTKSFTFTGAQIDVQGTSSAGYARKNYKVKLKKGITQNGEQKEKYQLRDDSIPASTFTFKADVASSEGANNVELVRLYNDTCPYQTPPQIENPSVRQGIDGFPIVIFQNDGENITFIGKYNFNEDKSSADTFGFSDGDESWETLNNTSNRTLFKSADFEGEDWKNDFEARYLEENEDTTNLADFAKWVVSTDREQATNNTLEKPISYDGVEYIKDTAEYRLAKFRAELTSHAELQSSLFYYLFTAVFLMVDSRAKNAFPSLVGGDKICWLPYDMDTGIGIDNEGKLKFGYELEDIDTVSGADVYNGQRSVFWCNLRDAFPNELASMYQQLRSNNKLSYDVVEKAYENHQAIWPEAIWNEDAYFKYLEPLINDGSGIYLPMLQGSKSEQRKWWLYNRFRYMDSKYNAGDSLKDFITLRGYAKSDITITPYADIYASVKYGSYLKQVRALRGSSYKLECPLDNVNDTEIYIYSASQLKDVGDLSGLKVGLADFSMATKLQNLKVGDPRSSYTNGNLVSLTLGNNILLKTVDARNCSNLGTGEQQTIDLSGCTNIEEVYLTGTSVKGINLPNGGILKVLHVPDTITNLTIRNQPSLTDLTIGDSSNITTLRLENVGALVDVPNIIAGMADGSRIRATDINWSVSSENELISLFDKINKMRGLDENGNNTNKAVLSGRVRVSEKVSDSVVGDIYNNFPDLVIDDGSDELYIINYKDWDGTILYSYRVAEGENAIDPIAKELITAPSRKPDENYSYEFVGWNNLPTNINRHYQIIAQYRTMVAVNFAVDGKIIHSEYVIYGSNVEDPVVNGTIQTPTKEGTDDLHYAFKGWDGSLLNITIPRTINALWTNVYPVRFYTDSTFTTLHYTQWVIDGEDAHDPVTEKECDAPADIITENEKKLSFSHWSDIPKNVTKIEQVYAQYDIYWAARFLNDGKLYLLEWTLDGSDVVEPKDYFEDYTNPTRESTAQYDYAFSKWDGNFTAITEARDYNATYTNTVRRYRVRFYNDTTLLQTVKDVPYGSSATYTGSTPTKLGVSNPEEYIFKGWLPATENITGDTDCYALFKFTGYLFGKLGEGSDYGTVDAPNWDLINAYWDTIDNDIKTLDEDALFVKYPIGGRMVIPVALSDGTVTADVEIIAHNHDSLADDTGLAPLTFFCVDLPQIQHAMNQNKGNVGGWKDSDMREFVNNDLLNALPSQLTAIIKPVTKLSDGGSNNKTIVETTDNCWIASAEEVGLTLGNSGVSGQGKLYNSIFSSDKDTRKKYITDDTSAGGWWTRSSYYSQNNSSLFYRVTTNGTSYTDIAFNSFYVAFGFCI